MKRVTIAISIRSAIRSSDRPFNLHVPCHVWLTTSVTFFALEKASFHFFYYCVCRLDQENKHVACTKMPVLLVKQRVTTLQGLISGPSPHAPRVCTSRQTSMGVYLRGVGRTESSELGGLPPGRGISLGSKPRGCRGACFVFITFHNSSYGMAGLLLVPALTCWFGWTSSQVCNRESAELPRAGVSSFPANP